MTRSHRKYKWWSRKERINMFTTEDQRGEVATKIEPDIITTK